MILYEEIIFLQHHAKAKFVVENVKPYYPPLIAPTAVLQRHLFWTNFPIQPKEFPKDHIRTAQIPQLSKLYGFNLDGTKLPNKRQVLRNCVSPLLGEYILSEMEGEKGK
jgi:DNA (cytosine-5)-methyltransferase 1